MVRVYAPTDVIGGNQMEATGKTYLVRFKPPQRTIHTVTDGVLMNGSIHLFLGRGLIRPMATLHGVPSQSRKETPDLWLARLLQPLRYGAALPRQRKAEA
jgi:hypothetical protein